MSRTNHGAPQRSRQRTARSRTTLAVVASVTVAVAIAVGVVATSAGDSSGTARRSDDAGTTVEYTGERNGMGLPVVEPPGVTDGTASTSSVTVEGATWSLGQVPLNVAVRPTWALRNVGTAPITIGQPHAEVLAGCCPGAFTIDMQRLAVGDVATLTFELAMHPGMDGWHEMAIHVPVADETLTLGVNGDFR